MTGRMSTSYISKSMGKWKTYRFLCRASSIELYNVFVTDSRQLLYLLPKTHQRQNKRGSNLNNERVKHKKVTGRFVNVSVRQRLVH